MGPIKRIKALHRRYGRKGREWYKTQLEIKSKYPIRYFEGMWGNDNPMWVTPFLGEDSINQAAADLARMLSRGGEITSLEPDSITASNWSDDDFHHNEITWSGSVEDMTLLRRVAVMWALGYDLSPVSVVLSGYGRLSWQATPEPVYA